MKRKTRKMLVEEMILYMNNAQEMVEAVQNHPTTQKLKDVVIAYATVEQGVNKVHYQCRKCGNHHVTNGSYAYAVWECPTCGNDNVQNSPSNVVGKGHLSIKETEEGFFAMTYDISVSFDRNASQWSQTEPTVRVTPKRYFMFDRNVDILVAEKYQRYMSGAYQAVPEVMKGSTRSQMLINTLLYTPSDNITMSQTRWSELVDEVRAMRNEKEQASQARAAKKTVTVDVRNPYQAAELSLENIVKRVPMRLAKVYERNGDSIVYRVWCSNCGQYTDYTGTEDFRSGCPHCKTQFGADADEAYGSLAWTKTENQIVLFENTSLPENDLLIRQITLFSELVVDESGETKMVHNMKETQRIFLSNKIHVYGSLNAPLAQKMTPKSINKSMIGSNVVMPQSRQEIAQIITNSNMAKSGMAEAWGLVNGYKGFLRMPNLRYVVEYYKRPELEMLAKGNVPKIAEYYTFNPNNVYYVSSKNIYDVLDVPKPVLKVAQQHDLNYSTMQMYKRLYKLEQSMTWEKFQYVLENNLDVSRLVCVHEEFGIPFSSIFNYLDSAYDHQCIVRNHALIHWYDYLNMAKKIGMDLTNKNLKFPNSLKKEHDIAMFAHTALVEKEKTMKFSETALANKKYEYAYGDFVAIIPSTPQEIIEEASRQNNCLRSYIERVRDGVTVVAFVRYKDNPDDSYVSVEIREGRLAQVKAAHNQDPKNPKLAVFLSHWCEARDIDPAGHC